MGLVSDQALYLGGLVALPGVMPCLGHAALPWAGRTSAQACLFKTTPSQEVKQDSFGAFSEG